MPGRDRLGRASHHPNEEEHHPMVTKQLTTETDVVASVNDKGLRLRGHDAWPNFSKFPDKQVPHPMQGETVTVTYDTARWIDALIIGEEDVSPTVQRAD